MELKREKNLNIKNKWNKGCEEYSFRRCKRSWIAFKKRNKFKKEKEKKRARKRARARTKRTRSLEN